MSESLASKTIAAAMATAGLVSGVLILGGCGVAGGGSNGEKPAASPAAATPGAAKPGADGHRKMVELLQGIRDRTAEENPMLGDRMARELRAQLAALPAGAPLPTRFQLMAKLGQAELNLGNERVAIELLDQVHAMLPELSRMGLKDETVYEAKLRAGLAHLRFGETQNCCLRPSAESCILPIRKGGLHSDREGSMKALAYFEELLRTAPPESAPHLDARWLATIARQTLGEYPENAGPNAIVPPAAFRSHEDFPRFTNIAPRVGLDTFHLSGGAIADDFDNDGYLDLLVSTLETHLRPLFFRNQSDGTFVERGAEAGLEGIYGGLNMVQADYDNDGDLDVLVLRGAWWGAAGRHPKSLLRNDGGSFTDVTFDAGLGHVHYPTQTGSFADYDNDGDLDLYVGNESSPELNAPSQLFRNAGDGTFTDVAEAAGVTNLRFAKAVIWGDYDGDRFPDLYVSNRGSDERLYRNNGDGTFTDVAPRLNVTGRRGSFPAWFWDVDNDGHLDLWVSAYATTIAYVAASYLGMPVPDEALSRLYRGDGKGGFEDVSRAWGLTAPSAPMGSNFGDLDNDGWLDFYLGTGDPDLKNLMPNLMYRNAGGRRFVDVTFAGGFGHLQKGHGVVFADLDQDGDQDVFEQMGGAVPADRYRDVLYENPGFGNHWIAVQLVGTQSNRSAIGARIRVDVVESGKPRSIYRHVNSGGTFGSNPLRQHIGLGSARRIERLSIFWPTTGATQVLEALPIDRTIRIVESQGRYEELPLRRARFGGPDER